MNKTWAGTWAGGIEHAVELPLISDATVEVSTWSGIQTAINNADDYTETLIRLVGDVKATSTDVNLTINANRYIILDLNGYTLTRDCDQKTRDANSVSSIRNENDKYCITISDKSTELNITDSSGKDAGTLTGLIRINAGTLNIKSGSFNTDIVSFSDDAVFNMSGGVLKPIEKTTNGEPAVDLNRGGTFNRIGGELYSGSAYAVFKGTNKGKLNVTGDAVVDQRAFFTYGKATATAGYFDENNKYIFHLFK